MFMLCYKVWFLPLLNENFETFCFFHFLKVPINPLSPNSDQDQFSLNDIHTLSRDLVMRIYKMNTYCFALVFYQILSTHSLRKYIKISLENLYVDIMGLNRLSPKVHWQIPRLISVHVQLVTSLT